MADDGSLQAENRWPLPKFYFSVDLGAGMQNISFHEVSGLDSEAQLIEYRHANAPQFVTSNMPGIKKYGNITLKKGIFVNDNVFSNWYAIVKMNTIKRSTITINLMDESGSPTMTWTLQNAWPTKISTTDLKSNTNETAVESIEIAYEGLTITNPKKHKL